MDPLCIYLHYLFLLVVVLCNSALGCRRGTGLLAFKLFLDAGQSAWQRARLRAVHDLETQNKMVRHIHKYTYSMSLHTEYTLNRFETYDSPLGGATMLKTKFLISSFT